VNRSALVHTVASITAFAVAFSLIAAATVVLTTYRWNSHALLIEMTPAQVAEGATLAVRGSVLGLTARPAPRGGGVVTDVVVHVTETLKGNVAASSVIVTVRGGRYRDVIEVAEDVPAFGAGEDVILFLVPTWEGGWQTYGGTQAKFAVSGGVAESLHATLTIEELRAIARSR
jgi:hypothetical protein